MRTIHDWLSAYGVSHQNATNKTIHWICVPTIMFSLIGLLTAIPSYYLPLSPYLNWGSIFFIATLFFYLHLSIPIFIGFIFVGGAMVWGNILLNDAKIMPLWQLSLILFVVAWIGQFIGHKIEGEKPSFFDDLQFLLIGPAWLMSFVFQKFGIKY